MQSKLKTSASQVFKVVTELTCSGMIVFGLINFITYCLSTSDPAVNQLKVFRVRGISSLYARVQIHTDTTQINRLLSFEQSSLCRVQLEN